MLHTSFLYVLGDEIYSDDEQNEQSEVQAGFSCTPDNNIDIGPMGDVGEDGSNAEYIPQQKRRRHTLEPGLEWTETDNIPNIPVFTGQSGVPENVLLDDTCSEVDFFHHFIDDCVIKNMKEQTNAYARTRISKLRAQNKLSPNSRFSKWTTVTQNEIKKCIAIVLHMSISCRPDTKLHWTKNPVFHCSFCPNVMRRDRFLSILSMFHLNDNSTAKAKGEPGYDPLHKLRPLMDKILEKFNSSFQTGEAITIDEGICAFRGRVGFKIYMPQKPNKYGIKIFMLADANTAYIKNFEVYTGKDPYKDNSAAGTVLRLLSHMSGSGHTVYVDRFFTSIDLAERLETLNIGLVGTIIKTRKNIPPVMKTKKLKKGEQIFRRKNNILLQRWRDKRDVWMITTRHTSNMSNYINRRGMQLVKPLSVQDYNKNKSGVDLFDQRISYGCFDHRSLKWWRKLAFYFLMMSVSNACILYKYVKGRNISTSSMMEKVCNNLIMQCNEDFASAGSSGDSRLGRLSQRHFPDQVARKEG